ncbi:MAG: formate dehydrogenase accessory sulfurtransferase FdhD [Bacteroidetes bacterium]|nr:MAG: formate dehydrogenase accessory sulfurtransferase FdhD [Bacteroidota bacterium]
MEHDHGIRQVRLTRYSEDGLVDTTDYASEEEPLELVVEYGPIDDRNRFTLAITMRTPGNDAFLLRGFLLTEGIVETPEDIQSCKRTVTGPAGHQSITAALSPGVVFSPEKQQRHFYTTSSCGVCGKTSIDMVRQVTSFRPVPNQPSISAKILYSMSRVMLDKQFMFQKTGGIHAAGLFDSTGKLLAVQEDVGRHNAVDKLIGTAMTKMKLPLNKHVLMVSGRAGFELVQKASVSGIALFAAVGAPSSLAIELAEESGMTLIGFLKDKGFNIYTHPGRIVAD